LQPFVAPRPSRGLPLRSPAQPTEIRDGGLQPAFEGTCGVQPPAASAPARCPGCGAPDRLWQGRVHDAGARARPCRAPGSPARPKKRSLDSSASLGYRGAKRGASGTAIFGNEARDKYKHLADVYATDTSKSLDLVFCGVERVSKGDEVLPSSRARPRRQDLLTLRRHELRGHGAPGVSPTAIAFRPPLCRVRAIRPVVGIALRRWRAGQESTQQKQLEVGSWLLGWKQAVAR